MFALFRALYKLPLQSFFAAIGRVILALGPQQTARPATAPGAPGAPRAATAGATRQNLMMGGAGQAQTRGGGGLWGNVEAFQNPHGDFTPAAAAQPPRAVTPPSEESIEMLMVSVTS